MSGVNPPSPRAKSFVFRPAALLLPLILFLRSLLRAPLLLRRHVLSLLFLTLQLLFLVLVAVVVQLVVPFPFTLAKPPTS